MGIRETHPRSSGRRRRATSDRMDRFSRILPRKVRTPTDHRTRELNRSALMDDTYYRYPVGSQEHYAAYERYFISNDGIDAAVPGNPQASYEADNAYELAYERENEHLAQKDW